jgi:hypothetical protein
MLTERCLTDGTPRLSLLNVSRQWGFSEHVVNGVIHRASLMPNAADPKHEARARRRRRTPARNVGLVHSSEVDWRELGVFA